MSTIQTQLDDLVEKHLPGAFVYLEDTGGSSQFYTSGFADLLTKTRMTPDMRYRVGSVTKTFTATVTLQHVAEGQLSLDDLVQRLLPALDLPNADTLTVEHLLRMRSGIFDFEEDPALKDDLEAHLKPVSLDQALEMGLRHPAGFKPGERFSYSNTNFCLLEKIIETLTGISLGRHFTERIFNPLGMASSSYPVEDDLSLPEPYIHGYEHTSDSWFDCSHVFFGRGDGALISTAIDLGRFYRALLARGESSLLPDDLLERMMTIPPGDSPEERRYGMGLSADVLPVGTVWGHSGGGLGYLNFPFLQLESGRFAVFMCNGTAFSQGKEEPGPGAAQALNELRAGMYPDLSATMSHD